MQYTEIIICFFFNRYDRYVELVQSVKYIIWNANISYIFQGLLQTLSIIT